LDVSGEIDATSMYPCMSISGWL